MIETNPWPALECSETPPQQLKFELGVWGKVHGASSDFRWIAVSPSFKGRENALERKLFLGDESLATTFSLWRTVGDTHYAIHCYPSRAQDAVGRGGFLEKQILEWQRPANLPALLGSLLLLSQPVTDEIWWWEPAKEITWLESDAIMRIEGANISVSWLEIEEIIQQGCQNLAENLSEDKLTDFYAQILAGQQASLLIESPLKAEALAVLLLPLSRFIADKLSITGWLPSQRTVDIDKLHSDWNIICTNTVLNTSNISSPEYQDEARKMSQAVLANEPKLLNKVHKSSSSEVQIALWGPTSAGKTMFLGRLYDEVLKNTDWDIVITEQLLRFINSIIPKIEEKNIFPPATVEGNIDEIIYNFHNNKTNDKFSILLEDRAGQDYMRKKRGSHDFEGFDEAAQERLKTVNGLILLFDHLRGEQVFKTEIHETLRHLQVTINTKDTRPIAICLSKADILIQSIEDYHYAKNDPDKFVRSKLQPDIVKILDNFCTNYRFFPVSAAGLHILHGSIGPTVFYDENLQARICPVGKPFNLLAPVTWLYEQLQAK
jgi:GTPase SAR1 family protein